MTSCVEGANQKLWFSCEQKKILVFDLVIQVYTVCSSLTYKQWVVHCNLKKLLRVLGSSVKMKGGKIEFRLCLDRSIVMRGFFPVRDKY